MLDRTRGGSFVAFAISASGIFGVFLFLTYYLQQTLGYSPVRTGLAFLPMVAALMVTATLATARLAPRFGSRPLVPAGMLLAAAGMFLLTRLGVDSTYAADILPALLPLGLGMGLIFAPSMSAATAGVAASDAGVASAMVNTTQQVGGAVGTALLNTLFAAAITDYVATHGGRCCHAGRSRDLGLQHGLRLGHGHLRRRRDRDRADPAQRHARAAAELDVAFAH